MKFFTGYAGAYIFNAALSPRDFGGYIQYCCGYSSIKGYSKKTDFKMYPNPANNKLTVNVAQNDNSVITMYDAVGKQVMQQKAIGLSTELNVSNLPQGMYFINVNGTTQKVVISE